MCARGGWWWFDVKMVCENGDILMRFPYDLSCFEYIDQGSSAFFSCALTVNVIGLLFLRQCFIVLHPSMETSVSGTSRKLPLCGRVSQYVYWRRTSRNVNSCYSDWRVQSGVWGWLWWCVLSKMVEKWCWRMREIECTLPWPIVTTYVVCDQRWYCLMRCPYYISCFLAVVRFPFEISCLLALVPNTIVSK